MFFPPVVGLLKEEESFDSLLSIDRLLVQVLQKERELIFFSILLAALNAIIDYYSLSSILTGSFGGNHSSLSLSSPPSPQTD